MESDWTTKWSWGTTFSADSVEWCPVDGYTDILVCGTYQLEENNQVTEKPQTRLGRIYLFIIKETSKSEPIQTINTHGILDQKWCQHKINDQPILATVTSVGTLQLYQLIRNETSLCLNLWMEEAIGQNLLALSLDWSTNKLISNTPCLLVSDSSGAVTLFSLDCAKLSKIGTWKAHGFEAWITAFNYWNTNIFYTGGDDSLLKSFDSRMSEMSVGTNKSHEAGVTSIRCHTEIENQLITGSYDEKIRLFDTRNLKRSVTEVDVGGGVWRLKWHPYNTDIILAACMYGGFRTVKLTGQEFTVIREYLEHDSIAYGADWAVKPGRSVVATCSFYDCKLNISEVTF